MSDSREQFEAWVLANWPEQEIGRFSDGEYLGYTVQLCWQAWQASRQALVVELPKPEPLGAVDPDMGLLESDVIAAIEAAGIRTKP